MAMQHISTRPYDVFAQLEQVIFISVDSCFAPLVLVCGAVGVAGPEYPGYVEGGTNGRLRNLRRRALRPLPPEHYQHRQGTV